MRAHRSAAVALLAISIALASAVHASRVPAAPEAVDRAAAAVGAAAAAAEAALRAAGAAAAIAGDDAAAFGAEVAAAAERALQRAVAAAHGEGDDDDRHHAEGEGAEQGEGWEGRKAVEVQKGAKSHNCVATQLSTPSTPPFLSNLHAIIGSA